MQMIEFYLFTGDEISKLREKMGLLRARLPFFPYVLFFNDTTD